MKIGIRSLESLKNGHVLIEADTKEEIELLNSTRQMRRPPRNKSPETKESQTNNT